MHYDALIAKMDGGEIIISRIIFNFNFASSSRAIKRKIVSTSLFHFTL